MIYYYQIYLGKSFENTQALKTEQNDYKASETHKKGGKMTEIQWAILLSISTYLSVFVVPTLFDETPLRKFLIKSILILGFAMKFHQLLKLLGK